VRPYPEEIIRIVQTGVMTHLAPEVQSSYGKAQTAFMAMLFALASRDADGAVETLVESNAAVRGLLADAASALAQIDRDDARAARTALGALPAKETSLRLSALRKESDALRGALASLAPLIEPAADDAALAPLRDVRTRVYAYLSADARKRIVPILSA
jgi:hypothetical protein